MYTIGPRIVPCGIPDITRIGEETEPFLANTCRESFFTQKIYAHELIVVNLSNPYSYRDKTKQVLMGSDWFLFHPSVVDYKHSVWNMQLSGNPLALQQTSTRKK